MAGSYTQREQKSKYRKTRVSAEKSGNSETSDTSVNTTKKKSKWIYYLRNPRLY